MRTLKMHLVLVSVLLLVSGGCAKTVNIPQAESASKSAIAISIHARIHLSYTQWGLFSPSSIYFIKLNDEKDSIRKADLIPSNYVIRSIGRRPNVFLLNVEPGMYAAVGAVGKASGVKIFAYFPEEMVKKTTIHVKPNSFYYVGTFTFETGSEMYSNQLDATQNFYYKGLLLGDHREVAGKQKISNIKNPQYIPLVLKESNSAKSDEIEFLKDHKEVFKSTGWDSKIQNRLNELEKREGTIH